MAKAKGGIGGGSSTIEHVKKRTTIGRGRLKMSSMNKNKRRSHKPYVGQGKAK
jgi:hypothetical protein